VIECETFEKRVIKHHLLRIGLNAVSIGIEKAAYEGLQDVFLDRYELSKVQVHA